MNATLADLERFRNFLTPESLERDIGLAWAIMVSTPDRSRRRLAASWLTTLVKARVPQAVLQMELKQGLLS